MRMRDVRRGVGCFAALLAVTLLNPSASPSQTTDRKPILEGARKEGKLAIYSVLAVPDHSQIVDRFRLKYPFIDVALVRPGGSERITSRILTEARAGQHLVDVIGVSLLNMHQLIKRNLVTRYPSTERERFDPNFKDREGFWTAFYVNPSVIPYNTNVVRPEQSPKTYQDLLDPKWKGQLVMEQRDIEFFSALVRHWGEENGLAYMRRLARQQITIRSGHTLITQLVAAGEHPAAVSTNGPRVELTKRRGAPIDWNPPDPTVVDVVTMGIAAHAPHPNAAKLYLDHVLSREIQEELLEETFVKPSGRTDVKSRFMTKIRGSRVRMIPIEAELAEQWEKFEKLFQEIFSAR